MKIIVLVKPPVSAIQRVQKRFGSLLKGEIAPVMDLDCESEEFGDYLKITRKVKEGTDFNPLMEFEDLELEPFTFFRPLCRGPVFS